jgi:hypothetical protein
VSHSINLKPRPECGAFSLQAARRADWAAFVRALAMVLRQNNT